MAVASKLYKKRVLVVEDQEAMRQQLRQSLTDAGCERLLLVANIQAALDAIAAEKFDLILCDYYLGDNTNGQQFLEYVRTRDLISRNTLFIMITAEQSYQKVVLVAECTPDDYLLKPFTPAQLDARLERLLDRQTELSTINRATDGKRWDVVIAECDRLLLAKTRYRFDVLKIKGSALLKTGRIAEARAVYEDVLQQRPLAWAKLGLARAFVANGERALARELLRETIAEAPMFLQAYDLLARVLAEDGEQAAALEVLQHAGEISPGTMNRLRMLSNLAVNLGRDELAETVMSQALEANRYSPVREVSDYALLSRALVNQDKSDAALGVVRQARRSFADPVSDVVLSASECVAHQRAGDAAKAQAALARATGADLTGLPVDVTLAVADACLACGQEDRARDLIKQAVQNHPDDASLVQKVETVLAKSDGKGVKAAELIAASRREIIQLNNEGVRKAEAGELDEAIRMLSAAADRLPNNLQIVGNAALAMAQHLLKNGADAEMLKGCLRYRHSLAAQAPGHPKLAQIDGLLQRLRR